MTDRPRFEPDQHPAGGWGSLKAVTTYLLREGNMLATGRALLKQNQTAGFACVSCAWANRAIRTPRSSARTARRRPRGS